ncbi:tRNA (N(6)-L-threonylcarbamoyladenosine(37)-C(2))-methylthiotransferase MtaB [Bythopirellula polymerisocia]|uniref:Threonylcarbamoyladenosine tRNA methylthiotransferase MtaB n=1 Tax=Bythopirellula polymerisocia TaxID=2528003 RepID=A0A5C6CVH4_9BACT|nr:tRNA (N(6)-L-threonylcarbamoyladenosine(37)-C(2))-methylthiotransferase MtaB [Bythopirellula polymerisocia]TWU28580.1 Threonylcarbamoyladenosine tRNA methylthiotransferase MtaB [Bythopirellula polymerisocia]
MPALKTVTLGCKVNQYETEFLREGLLGIGYQDAVGGNPADLCVVNTCTVTSEGDSKSRQIIRRLARENPASKIVVMGCYATRAPEEVARLPNVTEVLTDKRELGDLLGRFGVTDVPTGISGFGRRHRAYVKVQDGCLLRCSFCIIPMVRPELASRPMLHILTEVRRLVANGYREVVLTGIHLGHYGVDWNRHQPKENWTRLSHLVRAIAELPGDFRVRLSSIEATEVTRELIEVMAEHPEKICPHLHISMQSGSDSVLRRMRRRWGSRRFIDRCQLLQERLDQPAITTDIIVGFPGETDREFEETCETARQVGFSKIHIFPFSARRGTPAAEMPEQLSKSVKHERMQELTRVEAELRDRYFSSLEGRKLRVLVESELEEKPGYYVGTSCRYAPVAVPSGAASSGEFLDVIAGSHGEGRIVAE